MEIPHRELSPERLREVIVDYISQSRNEPTDTHESIDDKVNRVKQLLETGKATITFDRERETCNIRANQQDDKGDPRFKPSQN